MRYKIIPIALMVLMLGGILTVFSWHRSGNRDIAAPPLLDGSAGMQLNNLRHLAVKEGVTQWVLEAVAASMPDEHRQVALTDIKVIYYLADNTEIQLRARQGVFETATQNILVTGNVRLVYRNYVLQTEELQYDHQQRILRVPDKLHISQGQSQLKADRMDFDLNTRAATFSGNVQGSFHALL